MASQTGAAEQQPGGDALFLLRVVRASTQSMAMIFSPSRLRFRPCLPPRTLPAPPHPLWVAHHSLHLSLSLHFTCPTPKPLQNSTSAYTSVLICSAPTLGCIPAPFLITLISHTPLHGFSPALLQAHTGPLEPEHVPVPLQSCLIGIFWAENLPCMKNVPFFFFHFYFFFPCIPCLWGGISVCSGLSVPSGSDKCKHLALWGYPWISHPWEGIHTAQVALGRDVHPTFRRD